MESYEPGLYVATLVFKAGYPVVYGSADYPEKLDENGSIVVQQLSDGSSSLVHHKFEGYDGRLGEFLATF